MSFGVFKYWQPTPRKVGCDLQLTMMANCHYRLLRERIGNGYATARFQHIFLDFINAAANVVIGDRAKTYASIAGEDDDTPTPQEADAGEGKLGITVTAIPPAVSAKIGTKNGVMVTSVRPGSFADEIGLGKAAVITAINKKPITDEASYRAIVSTLKSKDDVVFVIQSPSQKGFNSYVGGTLP